MAHQQYSSGVEACVHCAIACRHCSAACLKEPDVKSLARCIGLNADCAYACDFAVDAMARGSEQVQAICALCADLCETCGDECAKHPMNHCRQCADACRRCADECRRMAQQPAKAAAKGAGASRAH